ncbi:MucR family transcriptional regulator [Pararhizobium haloflavum]|uniref:MucR family transcriptional regulator n=1 Tax=Pararhizobium haloflavum TaxID=2037914 RepID=UPI000C175433|nr:MucR family transcriptional regulator [Pararhizobium haloflavum]
MNEAEENQNKDLIVELTADVVAAYVSNNVVPTSELSSLIADVHNALGSMTVRQEPVVIEKPKPAVPVKRSVQDDQITCLECGLKFKSLKRHLMTHHNLSPEDYRDKWDLQSDYPMVAPAYAEARSRLAKEMGLGQKRKRRSK